MSSPDSPAVLRHASTVVVARPGPTADAAVEIYMVVRSAKSPFMPSTLVFPGGRLDPEDGDPGADAAWETAARRECEEETGIVLGGPHAEVATEPSADHAGVPLTWFDTWLTPSAESARRYLTRFYFATVSRAQGDLAEADGHETHDGRWATAQQHLARWDASESDLPPPTLCTLLRLAAAGPDPADALARLDPSGTILPKVELTPTGLSIVMPHDPAYDDLPGDALPAPARTHALPTRFKRDERVWRPDSAPSSPGA